MQQSNPAVKDNQAENVEIYTLGRFMIRRGNQPLSDGSGRSRKVWDLFKYLLAHRGKITLPDIILENMWSEREYTDPGLAVRSLIFRLRRLLEHLDAPEIASGIIFTQGGYKWSIPEGCRLDVDEFEKLCRQATALSESDPEKAIDHYRKAVSLYKGEFLPECSYNDWVVPERSHYRRTFLQAFARLAALLKASGRYSEIIELCETAMMLEYFEEEIHRYYLEALIGAGRSRQAGVHYREMADTFYHKMGAKPSATLRDTYNLTRHENGSSVNLDLASIREGLIHRQDEKGAFICDRDLFRYFYRQENMRSERTGQPVYLGILALDLTGHDISPEQLRKVSEDLEEVLRLNLRRGDVVTRYNNVQFLLILPGLKPGQAENVLKRIEKKFRGKCPDVSGILHKKCIAVPPPDL